MAAAILTAPKTSAPVKGIPSTTTITPLRRRKGAPEKPADITLPESVERVLVDLQNRLFEVHALIVCIHAQAEAKDCDSEVRWALEAALALFRPVIEDVDDHAIAKAAAEREVAR